MGKVLGNVATRGFSGKVGKTLVFRDGPTDVTYVAAAPRPSKKLPTAAQEVQKDKFRLAALYVARVVADVNLWTEYEAMAKVKGFRTTRNFIIADYFSVPRIWSFDLELYTGLPGSVITVLVSCLIRAKKVKFVIYNPEGTEIENGEASPETNNQTWTYTTTSTNEALIGSRIVVKALKMSGGESSEEITI